MQLIDLHSSTHFTTKREEKGGQKNEKKKITKLRLPTSAHRSYISPAHMLSRLGDDTDHPPKMLGIAGNPQDPLPAAVPKLIGSHLQQRHHARII